MQKILVIDDQLDAAKLLTTLLRIDGYDAEWLDGNWDGLLGEIEDRRPDLVILDVRLPGVDGLELLRQVRAHVDPVVARVPVLLASALDHRHEGKMAGADGFLLKPYTRQILLQTIKQIEQETVSP